MYRDRRYAKPNTVMMAGWVIADLLLGLAMLFFVLNTGGTTIVPTALIPSPTLTQTPLPTQTPIPTAPLGLDPKPVNITIQVDDIALFLQDNPRSTKFFIEQFDRKFPKEYTTRRAGLIIALGYHTSGNIVTARRLAGHAITLLQSNYQQVFSNTINKTYWWDTDEAHPVGMIELEIYFFTDGS